MREGWRVLHCGCEEPALLVVEGWLDGSVQHYDGAVQADKQMCHAKGRRGSC